MRVAEKRKREHEGASHKKATFVFDKFVTYNLRIIELDVKHIRQQDFVI